MTSLVTIEAVHPNPRDWSNDYGSFKAFRITVKSTSNGETRDVEWSRKVNAQGHFNEPRVGDQLETEFLKIDQPPGWKLKSAKLAGQGPVTFAGGGGGGPRRDDPEKTADIHRQVALKAASALFAPMLAQVDPMTSTTEWWTRFWALYDRAVDRLELSIEQRAQPQPQQMPIARRDTTVRTGASDLPSDAPSHPPTSDGDAPWGNAA